MKSLINIYLSFWEYYNDEQFSRSGGPPHLDDKLDTMHGNIHGVSFWRHFVSEVYFVFSTNGNGQCLNADIQSRHDLEGWLNKIFIHQDLVCMLN